jgi:hypothetical protein
MSNRHLIYVSNCVIGRPLTAEMDLVLPNVAIRDRKITANFNGWTAILPDDFANFFIYTPYQSPINLLSPKIVAGTLLYEPSLPAAGSSWAVETVYGTGQAVMAFYAPTIGPPLPMGFAIFNGSFPAGNWGGILEWKGHDKAVKDKAHEAATVSMIPLASVTDLTHVLDSDE